MLSWSTCSRTCIFEARITSCAHLPSDGKTETLFKAKWDFNWQIGYDLAKPIALPKGTRIIGLAHYDNSANNKFNPDPAKARRLGRSKLGRDAELLPGNSHRSQDRSHDGVQTVRTKPAASREFGADAGGVDEVKLSAAAIGYQRGKVLCG